MDGAYLAQNQLQIEQVGPVNTTRVSLKMQSSNRCSIAHATIGVIFKIDTKLPFVIFGVKCGYYPYWG
jgi:hypothetical protein